MNSKFGMTVLQTLVVCMCFAVSTAKANEYFKVTPLPGKAVEGQPQPAPHEPDPDDGVEVNFTGAPMLGGPEGNPVSSDLKNFVRVTGDTALDLSLLRFSAQGAMPPGLSLSPTGVLSGRYETDFQSGSSDFSLPVSAQYRGKVAEASIRVRVMPMAIVLRPQTLPNYRVGEQVDYDLASAFTYVGKPYRDLTLQVTQGQLPSWLSLSGTRIHGVAESTPRNTVLLSVAHGGEYKGGFGLTLTVE